MSFVARVVALFKGSAQDLTEDVFSFIEGDEATAVLSSERLYRPCPKCSRAVIVYSSCIRCA
jgi:hypothetical protein